MAKAAEAKSPSLGQFTLRLEPAWHRRLLDLAADLGAEFSSMIREMLTHAETEFRRRAAAGEPMKTTTDELPPGWPRPPALLRLMAANAALHGIVDDPAKLEKAAIRAGLNKPPGRKRAWAVLRALGDLAGRPAVMAAYAEIILDAIEEFDAKAELRELLGAPFSNPPPAKGGAAHEDPGDG